MLVRSFFLLVLLSCTVPATLHAQCSSAIISYPYNEHFEGGAGGWSSGGVSSDWAWGSPFKALIQSAASGTKCWVTGGLNGTGYNSLERSYVKSPCFDFSLLQHPLIKMKVYWECENIYDGASFQYSTDLGLTWSNVGTYPEVPNCLNLNWFNNGNILNLNTLSNPQYGWAGTVLPGSGSCQGGGGSNGWVEASHCLDFLAGAPQVQFRFVFGAGSTCNSYDGFAFDDIQILEGPTPQAAFSYSCTGNPLEYQFTDQSQPCALSYFWNFGDPASGSQNGSGLAQPKHTFSSPGLYTVKLIIQKPCGGSDSMIRQIQTLDQNTQIINPTCFGDADAQVQTTISHAQGAISYLLNPGILSSLSSTFNGLSAGWYTLTVKDSALCSIQFPVEIVSPDPLVWASEILSNEQCYQSNNASVTAVASGGNGNYSYTLLPPGMVQSVGSFSPLSPGNYMLVVNDSKGCSLSDSIYLEEAQPLVFQSVWIHPVSCSGGTDGQMAIEARGGRKPYLFSCNQWTQTSGYFANLSSGSYLLRITDSSGCIHDTLVSVPGTEGPCCDQVFIPNAFTPDNDGLNDEVRIQNTLAIELIEWSVYNRWGFCVFQTRNKDDFWNGHLGYGDAEQGVYYYSLRYRCTGTGKLYHLKGDITLLR